jgi:hypothetical protein
MHLVPARSKNAAFRRRQEMTTTEIKPASSAVRLSAAAQAVLKQDSVQFDTNATASIVHALKFR